MYYKEAVMAALDIGTFSRYSDALRFHSGNDADSSRFPQGLKGRIEVMVLKEE